MNLREALLPASWPRPVRRDKLLVGREWFVWGALWALWAALWVALQVWAIVAINASSVSSASLWPFVLAELFMVAVAVAVNEGFVSSRIGRFLNFVDSHNYEVCLSCGYPLSGLARVGCCPECGQEYDLEQVRSRWRRVRVWSISLRVDRVRREIFRRR